MRLLLIAALLVTNADAFIPRSITHIGIRESQNGVETALFAKKKKGGSNAGTAIAGTVTKDQVREIAEAKMADLNANDIEGAMAIIEGSARSMGYAVTE